MVATPRKRRLGWLVGTAFRLLWLASFFWVVTVGAVLLVALVMAVLPSTRPHVGQAGKWLPFAFWPSIRMIPVPPREPPVAIGGKADSSGQRSRHIPESVRHSVWRRDEGRCVKCGSQERLEFDHIIPFSKGGSNTERNVQLLCERCNRSKSASV